MPSCTPCSTSSPLSFNLQYVYNAQCTDTCTLPGCNGCTPTDAKCIVYNGAALVCSGIETGDTLETALQKLDEQVCSAIGDYSTYQFNCLEAWCSCTITTEAQFVDQITAYACQTRSNLNTFIGTTFPTYQSVLNARFIALEVPGITCATASVTSTSTLVQILNAYCTQITNIKAAILVSSVDWDQCFTVVSPPSTVIGGFSLLVDQICQVKAIAEAAAVLPIFNNTAYTCLSAPTSSDTLVQTITMMLDLLCTTAVFDPANVNWGCTGTEPATLELGVQQIVDSLDTLLQNNATYSGDFVITPVDLGDPCAGINVALATPLNLDRFVASNGADTSPGTLEDKLIAGTGVTLDYVTTPGGVIITSVGDTYKVKANVIDNSPDFLDEKVQGQPDTSGSITINTLYNVTTKQVDFTPSINPDALMELIFSTIENSIVWKARFCSLAAACTPGTTCTAWNISNAGTPMVDPDGTFAYTNCDGIYTITTLVAGASTSICAIGGIITTAGVLTIVEISPCSETTTTTTLP